MLEVFRDWEIRDSDGSKLNHFVDQLVRALPRGWVRDASREKELARPHDKGPLLVLRIVASTGLPAARLYLFQESNIAKVTNIVPQERSELTRAQYNTILIAFHAIANPVATKLGLEAELTSDQENVAADEPSRHEGST